MPTKLVRTILSNFSATGDVVYDPFMGAGTTAVVCEEMGRKWIGSEINPEYVEIALDRVDNVSTLNNFLI